MCTVVRSIDSVSPAAAFVAEHQQQIIRYGNGFFSRLSQEKREDAVQMLLVYCLEHHHTLRLADAVSAKSVINRWIYFQCMAVKKLMYTHQKIDEKVRRHTLLFIQEEHQEIETRIADAAAAELIDRLYDMANEDEKTAIIAATLEMKGKAALKAKMPVWRQEKLLRQLGHRAEAAGIHLY